MKTLYFEVVTSHTPQEGVKYHGRARLIENKAILWRSRPFDSKDLVYQAIHLLRVDAATAEVVEVNE